MAGGDRPTDAAGEACGADGVATTPVTVNNDVLFCYFYPFNPFLSRTLASVCSVANVDRSMLALAH